MVSPTNSELSAVIQSSDKFEMETDKSRSRALMVEQGFTEMGFLRVIRRNGELLFEFPDSRPGTEEWEFLESVAGQIRKLFHADSGRELRDV